MSRVFSTHAVSVDGYISGRHPDGAEAIGSGLGDAPMLFDFYSGGETRSRVFDGFRMSKASARVVDDLASRAGAVVTGHTTYEHSSHFGDGGPLSGVPLFVVSHGDVPEITGGQTLVSSGIVDAIAAAHEAAGGKDVSVMGGGALTSALANDLVDELILHQIPVLLGRGHGFFRELPRHIELRLLEAVPAPGVTHLHYEVVR